VNFGWEWYVEAVVYDAALQNLYEFGLELLPILPRTLLSVPQLFLGDWNWNTVVEPDRSSGLDPDFFTFLTHFFGCTFPA